VPALTHLPSTFHYETVLKLKSRTVLCLSIFTGNVTVVLALSVMPHCVVGIISMDSSKCSYVAVSAMVKYCSFDVIYCKVCLVYVILSPVCR